MRRLVFTLGMTLPALVGSVSLRAEVDQRPLKVQITPAFPDLEWPGWLTGVKDGLLRKILPIALTGAGGGKNRLFVATQHGTIFFFNNSPKVRRLTTFLDIRDRVQYDEKQDEEGFLGLAFHPRFAENGQFFVNYTGVLPGDKTHHSVISRFRVSRNYPNRADRRGEEILLTVAQPFWNHNGGTLVFGPDGYLYIALGDGGDGYDPRMNGQNLKTLLGSILRIDVDRKSTDHKGNELPYAIPADNPFANETKLARREIWAYGLRNVWRMSFDRRTGTFWAADVGQKLWEEINIIRPGGNYGWNRREGKHPVGPGGTGPREDYIEPIWEYGHEYGKSITGGHVYRGNKVPELAGAYLYADYVSGRLWALWYDVKAGKVIANRTLRTQGAPVMTFGEDDQGEVYFTSPQGNISKFLSPTITQ